jgi:isoquinoline 1-oxidoreductase beta subunit
MQRRDFMKAVGAGGLVVGVSASGCKRLDDEFKGVKAPAVPKETIEPVAWVKLDDTGGVTIVCSRSEMGQGIRTSMAMIIADEMEADWKRVTVEQAVGDEKKYGSQNTDGSTSIRDFLDKYREAGATVRTLLEAAAAKQWNVPAGECAARNNEVVHTPTGRTVGFGPLVTIAKDLPLPARETLTFKKPSQYRYVGKDIPSVDLRAMTTGTAMYGIDAHSEGMKYAVVARPPAYGSKVATLDSSEAEKVPGVEKIVRIPEAPTPTAFNAVGGVAVIARNTWAAIEGRKKLKITWTECPNSTYDSDVYRTELERTVKQPGKVVRAQGNVAQALARGAKKHSADYYLPHLCHAQMEPPAALATFANGKVEIWACTQDPQTARNTVAGVLKVPVDDVTVHVTLLGGGFGRKSKPDFIVEAAFLAREVGAPVKVVWTREDDIQHDFFHAVAAEHIEASLDADGKVTGWLYRSALPSIGALFGPNAMYQADWESGMGMTDFPYAVPNYRAEVGKAAARTRVGWYRSVINIPHGFAISSFIDELAHLAGRDPKEFLLELLGPDRTIDMATAGLSNPPWNYGATFEQHPLDTSRIRNVVELAASRAGWGQPLPSGKGRGIAVHRSFLSYIAMVVEAEVSPQGTLTIPRVDVAVDAGFVANPERARAQMEGAVIMGMSNSLLGELTFKQGAAVQSNYNDYRVVRMDGAPRDINVYLVESNKAPGGIGEPGVPPLGPALTNAIFAASGKRIRRLPVGDQLKDVGTDRGVETKI